MIIALAHQIGIPFDRIVMTLSNALEMQIALTDRIQSTFIGVTARTISLSEVAPSSPTPPGHSFKVAFVDQTPLASSGPPT